MRKNPDAYLKKADRQRHIHKHLQKIITALSMVVVLGVFWSLKLTGITMAGEAFCGKSEHIHTETCLQGVLLCQEPEVSGHTHDEACMERRLLCEQEESEEHTHTDECWEAEESISCGLEETQGHSHTIDCYEKIEPCPLEEHIHTADCYSNHDADLETAAEWEASLPNLPAETTPAQKLIQVAESQLGVAESTLNYVLDENGDRHAITRYGQWYGNPYGDWSAMFVSFCLRYADIEGLPANAGPESLRLEWVAEGLYGNAADFAPEAGQLLFLDKDENGVADSVAVITGLENEMIQVIEGDLENTVARTEYARETSTVLGYGRVPQNPQLEFILNEGTTLIGQAGETSTELLIDGAQVLAYLTDEAGSYAIDGNGELIDITIAPDGSVYTEAEKPELLLWNVTEEEGGTVIRNLITGMYLPQSPVMGISTYAAVDDVSDDNYQYARAVNHFIWLDGTNGGIMAYNGSPNTRYTLTDGATFKLPESWQSPAKYNYVLNGWYDIVNNKYYAPGEEISIGHNPGDDISGNAVFYADWKAASYDVGQFNAQVTDTISTNNFITTRMFDYSVLMNVLSERANVSFNYNGSSYTDTWNLLTSGNNPYNGAPATNFILRDWDSGGQDISYPNGHNDRNNPTDAGTVYRNLYTEQIRDIFFDPSLELPGKQYLGTGDYLFQLCLDPAHEHYGYYYYNSERNAASYNQSDQRFYVYNYLECTRTSAGSADEGKYADFLPLNSPYANTNGKYLNTYNYQGVEGEYVGTTHYMYDCRYNDSNNSTNYVGTNFWFGMSVTVDFFLPNDPGDTVVGGGYGNQDMYGKDMHFRFTGDDDVWIFVDDIMVLDLGGLHGMETGDINFSTGTVTINGVVDQTLSNNLKSIQAGDHELTLYYMERGSSMSNCAIYFNLAPRFKFSIQKEDVLTQEKLNGAQFSVFEDEACTVPSKLWTSQAAHEAEEPSTNQFTVENGAANMWGFTAGKVYYIKETRPPDAEGYGFANGIIKLSIDKYGLATYDVKIIADENGQISNGFTVHGFRIDEETQSAYIVATNAQDWVDEVTSVQVRKKWQDSVNHSGDYITVYLTVKDPDGTLRRIREVVLSKENNWTYTWDNLPKTYADGTEVVYGVQEAMVPGYVGKVEKVDGPFNEGGGTPGGVTTVGAFENGGIYLLSTKYGYLSATGNQLALESSQETAQSSNGALWVATVNGDGTVTLTNQAGQTLYYDNYTFKAGASPGAYKNLRFADNLLYCYIDHGGWSETQYPVDGDSVVNNLIYNHVLYTTNNSAQALTITPQKLGGNEPEPEPEPSEDGQFYQITNIPAGEAITSVTVYKQWDLAGHGSPDLYETLTVRMQLLANGEATGATAELNLRNGWKHTFADLPIYDSYGQPITYSVEEEWFADAWKPYYGDLVSSGGSKPTYSVTVTNTYYPGGPILPSTGTAARLMYILCGSTIMLLSLVLGIVARRKQERRMK